MAGESTEPFEVVTGVQPDATRYPCWNPVLFAAPDGLVTLFYKVGPSPRRWWGVARTSQDGGRTWSAAKRLPEGFLGPIKNKPVRLADGSIISPSSTETDERPSTWRIHFERTIDGGRSWSMECGAPSRCSGRSRDPGDPAQHSDPSSGPTTGCGPFATGTRVRELVRRSWTKLEPGHANGASQPELRDRCGDTAQRTSPDRLQPHRPGAARR